MKSPKKSGSIQALYNKPMEYALKNLDTLDSWVKEKVITYCERLLGCFPERISAICLYGSAAVGDHHPKHSDINLLILIDTLEMEDLKGCLQLVQWGIKRRITAPLLLTQGHIASSLDTFPIEFLEMKERHITLYGEDPFIHLVIDPKNLRLQCEQQIKGKLIRLRQAYLESGLKKKELIRLLITSLTNLLPVLRNTLRLISPSSQPPKTNEAIIKKIESEFHINAQPFLDILHIKKGIHKPDRKTVENIFEQFLHNLIKLSTIIDQINVNTSERYE